MKRLFLVATGLLVLAVGIIIGQHSAVEAQSSAVPLTVAVSGSHTSCGAVVSGQTQYCVADDGIWQSIKGATYVQVGATQAPSPITINGKTGTTFTLTTSAPTVSSNATAPALGVTAQ